METIEVAIGKTQTGEERAWVTSPYNAAFVAGARELRGRWQPGSRQWTFDSRDVDRVRALLIRIYGRDGSQSESELALFTFRVNARKIGQTDKHGASLWFAGREIARRPSRDVAVRLGEGCIVVEGHFDASGGSRNYPSLGLAHWETAPIVIEVRDVPEALAETLFDDPAVLDYHRQNALTGI